MSVKNILSQCGIVKNNCPVYLMWRERGGCFQCFSDFVGANLESKHLRVLVTFIFFCCAPSPVAWLWSGIQFGSQKYVVVYCAFFRWKVPIVGFSFLPRHCGSKKGSENLAILRNEPVQEMFCVVKCETPPVLRWKLCEFQHRKSISISKINLIVWRG